MATKKLVQKIINDHGQNLIDMMALSHYTISCEVLSSKSAKGQKLMGKDPCVAFCHPSVDMPNCYKVVIFHDRQKNKKDALGSLVHELLHVKLYELVELVTEKKYKKARDMEELIVQDLEYFIVGLLT